MCDKCRNLSVKTKLLKRKQEEGICKESKRQGLYGNEYFMLLDTGSTNVLLLGSECKSDICKNHNLYDVSQQREQWKNANVSRIGYVSGDNEGKIIYDKIKISNLEIKNQPIFICTSTNLQIVKGSSWDGIIGLGYWYNQEQVQPDYEKSIVDQILKQNLVHRKIFSYYIPDGKNAKASFGEIITELQDKQDLIKWVGVGNINIESQWQVSLYGIRLKTSKAGKMIKLKRFSKSLSEVTLKRIKLQIAISKFIHNHQLQQQHKQPCEQGCDMLLDTGTYLNYIPKNLFLQFFPQQLFSLDPVICSDFTQYPDIVFYFKHFNLTLSGIQYMDTVISKHKQLCAPSFVPDEVETDLITLGQVFLANFYTIFDFQNSQKQIGFYPIQQLKSLLKKK